MIMPLIKKPKKSNDKNQFRIRLDADICHEIDRYCEWAGLPTVDYFIEQSCILALKRDKEWKENKRKINGINQDVNKSEYENEQEPETV
jgi:hypothetical protein